MGASVPPSIAYRMVPSGDPVSRPVHVKGAASKDPRARSSTVKESPPDWMSSSRMVHGRAVQLRSWNTM